MTNDLGLTKIMIVVFAVLLLGAITGPANAQKRVKLVDQHGAAVANAVVSIAVKDTSDKDAVVLVDQLDKQFVPTVAIARAGQRVHFPNSDDVRHHVYSFSKAKPFELKLYAGNASEPILFDSQGVVVLGCNIHDRMVGYIYVAADEWALKTDGKGLVSFDVHAKDWDTRVKTIKIWHPRLGLQPETQIERSLPQPDADGLYVVSVNLQADNQAEKKSGFRARFQ